MLTPAKLNVAFYTLVGRTLMGTWVKISCHMREDGPMGAWEALQNARRNRAHQYAGLTIIAGTADDYADDLLHGEPLESERTPRGFHTTCMTHKQVGEALTIHRHRPEETFSDGSVPFLAPFSGPGAITPSCELVADAVRHLRREEKYG